MVVVATNFYRKFALICSEALSSLGWLTLVQSRLFHSCSTLKCVSDIISNSMGSMVLLANSDVHSYNTRYRDNLRLPRVTGESSE